MNLKSYLRGIGAGLIVAALLMGISKPAVPTQTKVDNTTLLEASVSKNTTEEVRFSVSKEEKGSQPLIVKEETVSDVSENTVTEPVEEKKSEEAVVKEQETAEPVSDTDIVTPPSIDPMPENDTGFETNGDVVEIRVIKGDSSVSVSRRLYEAGLVESAVEFDKYLCANGYDKFICVGTFEIYEGSDFETIAKIISRRK